MISNCNRARNGPRTVRGDGRSTQDSRGRTDGPAGGAADGRTDQNAEVNRRADGPVRGLPRATVGGGGQHAHKAHSRSCCHLPATEQKLIVGVYGILYLSKNSIPAYRPKNPRTVRSLVWWRTDGLASERRRGRTDGPAGGTADIYYQAVIKPS